ncbi:MAG: hypothetical protein AAFQ39_12400, partial [Pseudomonadota bacterium]
MTPSINCDCQVAVDTGAGARDQVFSAATVRTSPVFPKVSLGIGARTLGQELRPHLPMLRIVA